MTRQTFSHSLIIEAPAHDIYEYLIDPLRIAKHIDGNLNCTIVSGPSKGKGAVSEWNLVDGKGNLVTWEEEITVAIPDQQMSFRYRSYRNIEGSHRLEPVLDGTEITFTEIHDYEEIDPVACQRDVEHVLGSLKATMESMDRQLCSTLRICAPEDVVFDVITDLELFAELDPPVLSCEITSKQKRGVGVTSHWVAISDHSSKRIEWDEEITHYESPHQYAFRVTRGEEVYEGVHTLTKNADGTVTNEFCETFHFAIDIPKAQKTIDDLLENVKRLAEARTRRSGK
jgi:uncharacterized membrane protein